MVSANTSQPLSNPTQFNVSLVIPGRNCEKTLERCLDSVVPLKSSGELSEIIFVDDGSTDRSWEIAQRYPITILKGTGGGPGAARNLGWRAAESDLVWFIDSDCVAESDALKRLLPHLHVEDVVGTGGSYANLYPDSLIATLIHEEIVARHRTMQGPVNFLATYNVIYRKRVLAQIGGFREELKLAQDAELAYRIHALGGVLIFELSSRVGHHHPTRLWKYLKTQCRQGYYRVQLYRQHPKMIKGDSYAGLLDYLQPPLGILFVGSLPLLILPLGSLFVGVVFFVWMMLQARMTIHLISLKGIKMIHFLWFSCLRNLARGCGMCWGIVLRG